MGFAREQIEQGDELRPIAYRFGVNGDIEAMPVSTASQFDKNKTAIFLSALTKLPSTACVIFFTGAWAMVFDPPIEGAELNAYRKKRMSGQSLEHELGTIMRNGCDDTVATWFYDRDSRGKPVFDEKFKCEPVPRRDPLASGPEVDFNDPKECARFIKFIVDDLMAKPITTLMFTPRMITINANLAESDFLDLPKVDGIQNAVVRCFETAEEFEGMATQCGDTSGVMDMRERMADFPDADLFAYALFPKAGGNCMTLPMYCDGQHYEFGSPSHPLEDKGERT